MVAIMVEPDYAGSVWGKNLYDGLTAQLRQKRIAFCELSDHCPPEAEAVFLIAAGYDWATSVIRQLNRSGHVPILICNQFEPLPGCLYSCVCSDLNASTKGLLDVLKSRGKTKIALYGVGAASIADHSRVSSLFTWRDESFAPMEVFGNDGSLERCFAEFYPQRAEFDTVICCNDYAAISLVRNLRERDPKVLSRLTVISYARTRLSEFYRDEIVSLNINFEQYGRAALSIFELAQKNPFVSGMTVTIRWSLDGADAPLRTACVLEPPQAEDAFYRDPEIGGMLIADRYLSHADRLDRDIFSRLLAGQTYREITDACFLTEGAVKYRIRRLVQLTGAESKQQLLRLLRRYLTGEAL